jgi:ABC-type branched-subunit amino acid transport system substrate-binding protein
MLGAGMPPAGPIPEDAPQVIFRDDGGDPARAVRAVDDLASLHRVIAIIGPVEGDSALAAARRAQELGVPLIALSPAGGITEVGPMIFRLFVTPAREVEALAGAARARGATRFAVLRPDTPYGIAMRDAFEAELRAGGGELVADATYPADATSFGEPIATLGAARFDALFVPDAGRRLALIAPALAAAGLVSVPSGTTPAPGARAVLLLVPSVGWDAQLARRSGRYLQGAVFSRPFDPAGEPGAGAFAGEFRTRYGSPPDHYAAYSYDAFSLVRRAVQGGATTREALAAELSARGAGPTVGASGGFAANRGPARGTRLFELRGEALAPLN